MWLAIVITVLLAAGWYCTLLRRPAFFPPGPPGILSFFALNELKEPILSNAIMKMSECYGSVMGFILYHRRFVCVTGYQAVSEVLSNPLFSGRPNSFDFSLRTKGERKGVLMTDGGLWKEQRRFTIRHLKDMGFGKSSVEIFMVDEIHDLIQDINTAVDSSKDGNILLDDVFTTAVLNILWVMVASTRFKRGDPQMEHLSNCMNGFMRHSNGGPNALSVFPFLRFLAPERTGYNKLMEFIQPLRSYIENEVSEHKKTRQPNAPRDFIDVYLEKLDTIKASDNSQFDEEQLLGIVFDILIAGSETTSHTLGFALLYMILHPQIQRKVQEELDQILQGRPPSFSDKGKLPFTEATLQEIQRLGVVAPLTVPHVAVQDTTCRGYHIPKGCVAFINLWSTNVDPEIWPEPYKFLPERHLNDQGEFIKSDRLLTFGLGKRSCIGETLARSSLFLIFSSMMQNFRFEMPINTDSSLIDAKLQPTLDPIPGLTLAPRPCLARVTKRTI